MNFSKALAAAKADRLRIARKFWSTAGWFKTHDHTPGRWLEYIMALDGRTFGAPSGELFNSCVGQVIRVTVSPFNSEPMVMVDDWEPSLDDMLAADWMVVDDAMVEAVVEGCCRPWRPDT